MYLKKLILTQRSFTKCKQMQIMFHWIRVLRIPYPKVRLQSPFYKQLLSISTVQEFSTLYGVPCTFSLFIFASLLECDGQLSFLSKTSYVKLGTHYEKVEEKNLLRGMIVRLSL